MKAFTIVASIVAMLAASVAAQDPCRDRCNQFYRDCTAAGGTETFCGALRDSCLTECT